MTEEPQFDELSGNPFGGHIHASGAVIGETGILIRGASGAGKSRLVLTLTSMAEAFGYFARLVGDDRIYLERSGGRLVARGHPAIQGAIEWRGQGIFHTIFLDSVVLGLVIDLDSSGTERLRCPEEGNLEITLAGVKVAAMTLCSDLGPSDQASYILQRFRLLRRKNFRGAGDAETIP